VLGALDMRKAGDEWRVEAVDVVGDRLTDGVPAEQALAGLPAWPSDGGPPPSAAPWSLWLGALLGAAAVGVVTTSLVRAAERGANAALATA
jgi:hypothetical protein